MGEGHAKAAPYELDGSTGCDYCAYHGICGFDPRLEGYGYRSLENYTKEEVMEHIREEMDERYRNRRLMQEAVEEMQAAAGKRGDL